MGSITLSVFSLIYGCCNLVERIWKDRHCLTPKCITQLKKKTTTIKKKLRSKVVTSDPLRVWYLSILTIHHPTQQSEAKTQHCFRESSVNVCEWLIERPKTALGMSLKISMQVPSLSNMAVLDGLQWRMAECACFHLCKACFKSPNVLKIWTTRTKILVGVDFYIPVCIYIYIYN